MATGTMHKGVYEALDRAYNEGLNEAIRIIGEGPCDDCEECSYNCSADKRLGIIIKNIRKAKK